MTELAAKIVKRFDDMKSRRAVWESHWQEVTDYVLPRKSDIQTIRTPGGKRMKKVFDSAAIDANELLAGALHSMLTSPQGQWFTLMLRDKGLAARDDVRLWLDNTARRMVEKLNNSNFQTEIHEIYLDLGCLGTATLFIEADDDDTIRFSARPISEVFIATDARGRVDRVYRLFPMTAGAAAGKWGPDAVGGRIAKVAKEHPDEKVNILHAVFPRGDRIPGRRDGANKPFASVYVDPEKRHEIGVGGFDEWPFAVARWTKVSGEDFGRSPAMKALADIKQLNLMAKTTIQAAQKKVDPPMLVADDGVILPVRTTPASLNYARFLADGSDPIRPMNTGGDLQLGFEMEEQRRDAIRTAFFIDQLQLVGGPQMTATEVLQRTEEKLRLLGPMLGRLNAELLRPLIDRAFAIMLRAGVFDPPPDDLLDQQIDVEFTSPIAKAQRARKALGLLRAIEAAGPLISASPELMDNYDGDKIVRRFSDIFDVDADLLRPERGVLAIRDARNRAAVEEAQKQDLLAATEAAGKLLPALTGANANAAPAAANAA